MAAVPVPGSGAISGISPDILLPAPFVLWSERTAADDDDDIRRAVVAAALGLQALPRPYRSPSLRDVVPVFIFGRRETRPRA
jgi:hypothetical protein